MFSATTTAKKKDNGEWAETREGRGALTGTCYLVDAAVFGLDEFKIICHVVSCLVCVGFRILSLVNKSLSVSGEATIDAVSESWVWANKPRI